MLELSALDCQPDKTVKISLFNLATLSDLT